MSAWQPAIAAEHLRESVFAVRADPLYQPAIEKPRLYVRIYPRIFRALSARSARRNIERRGLASRARYAKRDFIFSQTTTLQFRTTARSRCRRERNVLPLTTATVSLVRTEKGDYRERPFSPNALKFRVHIFLILPISRVSYSLDEKASARKYLKGLALNARHSRRDCNILYKTE